MAGMEQDQKRGNFIALAYLPGKDRVDELYCKAGDVSFDGKPDFNKYQTRILKQVSADDYWGAEFKQQIQAKLQIMQMNIANKDDLAREITQLNKEVKEFFEKKSAVIQLATNPENKPAEIEKVMGGLQGGMGFLGGLTQFGEGLNGTLGAVMGVVNLPKVLKGLSEVGGGIGRWFKRQYHSVTAWFAGLTGNKQASAETIAAAEKSSDQTQSMLGALQQVLNVPEAQKGNIKNFVSNVFKEDFQVNGEPVYQLGDPPVIRVDQISGGKAEENAKKQADEALKISIMAIGSGLTGAGPLPIVAATFAAKPAVEPSK